MDLKHELYLARLAAKDPSERNRATQRIKVLEAQIQKRRSITEAQYGDVPRFFALSDPISKRWDQHLRRNATE